MNLNKFTSSLLDLMLEMWDYNSRLREDNRILKTQLQDANRKLAAMGKLSTSELLEQWAKNNACDAYNKAKLSATIISEDDKPFAMYKEAKERAELRIHSRMQMRPLTQQDWEMLEDYELATWRDWNETRMDAQNSGNP